MVPIASYYLGSTLPASASDSPSFNQRPQSMSQPPSQSSVPGPTSYRSSMPPPSRSKATTPPASAFINQPVSSPDARNQSSHFEPTPEEPSEEEEADVAQAEPTSRDAKRTSRNGIMNKDFRFPPGGSAEVSVRKSQPPPPLAPESLVSGRKPVITPSSVDIPPPPIGKENTPRQSVDDADEDVGPTVEISLN